MESGHNYPSMDQYVQGNAGGYGNPAPQYIPPQQQQQQHQYPQQQHQPMFTQQHRDIPNYGNQNPQYSPDQIRGGEFISNLSNNPLAQVGFTYGQSLFNDGKQYVDSNIGKYFSFSSLKSYFNVNTSYVRNKIQLLLFPFKQKTWKRRIHRQGDVDSYLPPRDDINAPDLYIPLMAFVTFYLLYGFELGMTKMFSPDKLGASISKGIVTWLVEIGIFKLGFFLTNSSSIPIYDMIAYSGYKYVLLGLSTILSIVVGNPVTFIFRIYLVITMGVFMLRTLRVVMLSDNSSDIHHPEGATVRKYFVFGVAIIQGALTWIYS